MNEKRFKKGLTRRLFSVVLALTMVVALMPINSTTAYAASYGGSTTFNGVIVTVTGDGWKLLDDIGWWKCGDHIGLYLKPSATTYNLYATDIGGDYITITNENGGTHRCSTCGATVSWGVSTHTHGSWDYTADGATLTAECKADGECTLDDKKVSLTLSASSANYFGISGLSEFNTATGKTIADSNVEIYKVDAADTTTGGTKVTGTPLADGYYYAKLTVETATAVKAFTIGTPGGSGPEVINPSSLAVAVTLPTTGSSISVEGELFPGATFSYNTDLVDSMQSAYGFFSDLFENQVIATTIEAGSTYTVYIRLQASNESEHPFTTEETKNLTEDETKAYFSSLPSEFTFVSGTLKPARFVAIFTYTVGNPGSGSKPDPKPTPSKSEAAAAPTIPTDYVAERVAEEEAMDVTLVTIDTTQYSKNEETVVPGTSYNLSKFITTKGIVKGIKTAVAAANNAKKDTVEIYTGKPFCFNKEIIKTIQESKKTVVYYFHYKGHIYSVTVPATVDASKVLEKAGFAGPLYVGKQLGTTKLVK